MRYFKNLLLSLTLIMPFNHVSAQESLENSFLSVEDYASTSMLLSEETRSAPLKRKEIELYFGSLVIKSDFLYEGETLTLPQDSYILKYKDYLNISSYVDGLSESCDIGSDMLVSSCKEEIKTCHDGCTTRVDKVINEKDQLKEKIKLKDLELKKEKTSKYRWSAVALTSGAGLGILIYSIAK